MDTAKKKRNHGTGSVYFVEKENVWVGAYKAGIKPNGRPDIKTVRGKTEAEANRKLNKLIDELKKEDYVYVQKELYSTFVTKWLTTVKKLELKPKSYDRLEYTINRDVLPYLGSLQVSSVSTSDIQKMISELVAGERSYSSVKKAYDAVNASFKWGLSVIPPKVKYNPAIAVKLPKKSTFDPVEIKYYNAEEARLISKTALTKYPKGTPWYPLGEVVVVLLNTGLRLSEVTALQWARDIDMENRLLYVHRNVVVIKNREDDKKKFVTVEQKTVKSAAGQDRVIPLNDDAFHAFQSLKEKTGHTLYVFATKQGERKSTRDIDKIVRRVEKRAGLPDDKIYGPHALRHTFATLLLQNGVDIKTVSELLGHADIGITYNTYIHVMKEQKAKAVASIPNFISGDDNTSCLQKVDN
jgi:integrase